MIKNRQILMLSFIAILCGSLLPEGQAANRGLALDEGLDQLVRMLADDLNPAQPLVLVVSGFRTLQGKRTGLGKYIAEEISMRFTSTQLNIEIVEGRQLDQVLGELCFNQTDLFNQSFTRKFGRFLGADLLMGSITDLDDTIRLNARIISTERRITLAAAGVTISKDRRVEQLLTINLEPDRFSADKCSRQQAEALTPERMPLPSQEEERLFENDLIRVTLKSLRRSGKGLLLEIWYENLTPNTMTLFAENWGRTFFSDRRGTYLLSNDGRRWLFQGDTQVGAYHAGTELIPNQRLLNRLTFSPERPFEQSEDPSETFSYIGHYLLRWRMPNRGRTNRQRFQVLLRGMRVSMRPGFGERSH